ncbi:metallophosphoesterase [Candidatus Viridilinea mediisalina]|uniref:UDP-2,3-diacylglucosamine hydrolase n=1 Tax=Candidatus Viridilinea mediisalina TaxID=2024553 RepID=A0A2A6RGC7_9CHLR|nr:metallophosphoesterase [Candidatus Viridilinea mediisalina]PDW01993.1 UDP-2,3-diacylglucosamine hydrolase [Candidatus Viridilinea mediisalina]
MQRMLSTASGGALLIGSLMLARWLYVQTRRVVLQPTPYTTPPLGPAEVAPQRRRIVVSDLHLGGGDRLDDFTDDATFAQFIDHYVAGGEPTDLILAGDSFEFLQIRLPDVADDDYSQAAALARIAVIVAAHRPFFAALARFVADPHQQLTILIGNHDFELHYPAVKAHIATTIGLSPNDPRLRFGLDYHGGGVYIVHGNQFDLWNRFVHFAGISEPFEVVRGSQLVKEVINDLEDDPLPFAALIDNVKPTSALFWYLVALPRLRDAASRRFLARGIAGFIQVVAWPTPHHMPLELRGPGDLLRGLPLGKLGQLATSFRRGRVARHREVARQVGAVVGGMEPPGDMIDQMQSEAVRQIERERRAFNDRFAREMRKLAHKPKHQHDSIFVCGHTHLARIVPLGHNQTYINIGTWTEIIQNVATMRRQEQRYPFLEITYHQGSTPHARLLVWEGPDQAPHPWHEGWRR